MILYIVKFNLLGNSQFPKEGILKFSLAKNKIDILNFLLSIPKTYRPTEEERDEVKRLMYECRNGITVSELFPEDTGERDRMYVTIKYMTKRKLLL